jgi:hypothetical protein
MNKLLNAGVMAGAVDPEKLANHRATEAVARLRLQETLAQREADRQRQYYDIETRSADRNAAIDAQNMRVEEARARQASMDKQRRDANLKVGERYAPDGSGRIEAIPGSAEYVRRSGLHSKDYQNVLGVETKFNNAIKGIDEILDYKNKDAFNRNFGGYNALITQQFPDAQNMKFKIESMKSNLKGAGLEMMRSGGSIGQMTEREWPIVERMIDSIDPRLGEKEARERIGEIKKYLSTITNNAKTVYETEWGNSQFYKGNKQGEKRVTNDAEYNTLPSGTEFIAPDGSRRRKP